MRKLICILILFSFKITSAQNNNYTADINTATSKIEPKVIAWRHDIHQNPELSNRETRKAALVAKHLQSLGIEVQSMLQKQVW